MGTICCLIVGLCFFGLKIFASHNSAFQFITGSLSGSIFFSLLKFRNTRDAFLILILIYLADLVFLGTFLYPLSHLFFFGAVGSALYVFFHFFESMFKELKFGGFLIIACLFALTYFLSVVILRVIYHPLVFHIGIFYNLYFGFLMGLGLGVGIDLSRIVNSRLWRET